MTKWKLTLMLIAHWRGIELGREIFQENMRRRCLGIPGLGIPSIRFIGDTDE